MSRAAWGKVGYDKKKEGKPLAQPLGFLALPWLMEKKKKEEFSGRHNPHITTRKRGDGRPSWVIIRKLEYRTEWRG